MRAPCLVLAIFALSPSVTAQTDAPGELDAAVIEAWSQQLSNWGRWGERDERGTLNLIDAAKRRQAAALVREGVSISLGATPDTRPAEDNGDPYEHTMLSAGRASGAGFLGDTFTIEYHGYAHTHIDALCHMYADGKLYNGFPATSVSEEGARHLTTEQYADGIVSRAVLFDIPRLHGVDWLEPGTAIRVEDLEAWEERIGVRVGPGDVVLIHTGRWARRHQHGPWKVGRGAAGLHASVVRWLKERDVAVLGSDAASDVLPSGVEGVSHPVHLLAIVSLGMPILDNLDLGAAADEAARLQRWEFMIVAAPLAVPGSTGSPVNPLALF